MDFDMYKFKSICERIYHKAGLMEFAARTISRVYENNNIEQEYEYHDTVCRCYHQIKMLLNEL